MNLPEPDHFDILKTRAIEFKKRLDEIRVAIQPAIGSWYPYDSFGNIWNLGTVLKGSNRMIFSTLQGKTVADIGAGDGDMGFFLEQLGADVHLIDNEQTMDSNMMTGMYALKNALESRARIFSIDLNENFWLPQYYDFALFLGILYHLQNPFLVLLSLATKVRRMVLSTRVSLYSAPTDDPTRVRLDIPVAYLLDSRECSNDPTNYWIFTESGLRRILKRTGWTILDYGVLGGDMETSDPRTPAGDRRAFCLVESSASEAS